MRNGQKRSDLVTKFLVPLSQVAGALCQDLPLNLVPVDHLVD
eukprot:SAG31_NODE_12442_length_942_cov_0.979834_2_plen_42_part_00